MTVGPALAVVEAVAAEEEAEAEVLLVVEGFSVPEAEVEAEVELAAAVTVAWPEVAVVVAVPEDVVTVIGTRVAIAADVPVELGVMVPLPGISCPEASSKVQP